MANITPYEQSIPYQVDKLHSDRADAEQKAIKFPYEIANIAANTEAQYANADANRAQAAASRSATAINEAKTPYEVAAMLAETEASKSAARYNSANARKAELDNQVAEATFEERKAAEKLKNDELKAKIASSGAQAAASLAQLDVEKQKLVGQHAVQAHARFKAINQAIAAGDMTLANRLWQTYQMPPTVGALVGDMSQRFKDGIKPDHAKEFGAMETFLQYVVPQDSVAGKMAIDVNQAEATGANKPITPEVVKLPGQLENQALKNAGPKILSSLGITKIDNNDFTARTANPITNSVANALVSSVAKVYAESGGVVDISDLVVQDWRMMPVDTTLGFGGTEIPVWVGGLTPEQILQKKEAIDKVAEEQGKDALIKASMEQIKEYIDKKARKQ